MTYLELGHVLGEIMQPVTVAERSKACTIFAYSNTEIVGSNPTGGMHMCVSILSSCCPVSR
jgi:hypothetical protein